MNGEIQMMYPLFTFHFSLFTQQVSNFTDLYFHIRHFSERKFRWNGIFILH